MPSPPELKNMAYERVRDWVLDGDYTPGDAVAEEVLARRLSISRTPVRAALDRLAADGLVRAVRGRGFVVVETTARTIREVFELREAVETFAVRHGQSWSQNSRVARLLPLFEYYRDSNDDLAWPDQVLLATSDSEFHAGIVVTLDNWLMADVHRRQLQLRTARLQGTVWRSRENTRVGCDGHLAIGNALLAGDRSDAEQELTAHLRLGLEHMTEAASRHVSERYRSLARRVETALETWMADPDEDRAAVAAFVSEIRELDR